jgi:hypothetical protein
VAIAALVLWLCTAGVGTYLVATATRFGAAAAEHAAAEAEPVPVPVPSDQSAPPKVRDPFAPPSLQRERSESLPLMRSLIEFTHPALAMIGFGFWFGYVVSRDRLFLAIALGIMLGAICAGVSWFISNYRAARRKAAEGGENSGVGPLWVSPRVLILHATGAGLTLLIAALIAARV